MGDKNLRKRGWSIQSETSAQTTQSEQELTEEEKRKLLENFPSQEDQNSEDHDHINKKPKLGKEQDDASLENEEGKIESNNRTSPSKNSQISPRVLEHAKSKLSKWAARLFDPNRPRGLIEPPKIIPLNDEFLTAFGKREKLFDEKLGRKINIDKEEIVTNDDESDGSDLFGENENAEEVAEKKDFGDIEGRKLKITNLPYVLDKESLFDACTIFGPVVDVNLIMDNKGELKGDKPMNIGKAYVIFEKREDAETCMNKMFRLKGRALRISMVEKATAKSTKGSRSSTSRYYVKDISIKCFRCGEIGHMESNCPNPAKLKPCALCAGTDHELRECSLSKVCFRCGRPGHINRDCREQQMIGRRRMVCSICFGSGHHRVSCRVGPNNAPDVNKAKCMVCGKSGHFMCEEMKWFFGLEGVTCFNCGRTGHHGYDCDRPNFDECLRNDDVVKQELERQLVTQLADEYFQQQNRGRDRHRDNRNIYRPRVQSQPPPLTRRDNGRGYSNLPNQRFVQSPQPRFAERRRNENRGYSTFRHR